MGILGNLGSIFKRTKQEHGKNPRLPQQIDPNFSDNQGMMSSTLIPTRRAGWSRSVLALAGLSLACTSCTSLGMGPRGPRHTEVFGQSTEGKAIRATILGEGRETFLMLGVIHGNEPLGAPLLERFIQRVEENPGLAHGIRLVVVPVVNPDGLAKKSRTNARGIDLNRNFPATNWRASRRHGPHPGSEPETRAILKILRQFNPSRILAVHSPLSCVNFDGPAEELARRMASVTPYPLRASIGYPTPGSLGSYAGIDMRTPIVTLELGRGASLSEAWTDAYPGLVAFVQHPRHYEPTYAQRSRTDDRTGK